MDLPYTTSPEPKNVTDALHEDIWDVLSAGGGDIFSSSGPLGGEIFAKPAFPSYASHESRSCPPRIESGISSYSTRSSPTFRDLPAAQRIRARSSSVPDTGRVAKRQNTFSDVKPLKRSCPPRTESVSSQREMGATTATGGGNNDSDSSPQSPLLACPLYKRNPYKHRDCKRYELRRIKDVKQHIQRRHTNSDVYCKRCFLVFSNQAYHDEHIRAAVSCEVRTCSSVDVFNGVSKEQQDMFNHYLSRGKSIKEQWYDMWDILFPGEERPASVYLRCNSSSGGIEDLMPTLRRVWRDKQTEIIAQAHTDIAPDSVWVVHQDALDKIITALFKRVEAEISPISTSTGSQSEASPVIKTEPNLQPQMSPSCCVLLPTAESSPCPSSQIAPEECWSPNQDLGSVFVVYPGGLELEQQQQQDVVELESSVMGSCKVEEALWPSPTWVQGSSPLAGGTEVL